MKDFENRLRTLTFLEPPPGLRGTVLAQRVSRWRTPPMAAWVALAAVWLALLAIDRLIEAEPTRVAEKPQSIAVLGVDQPTPLAFHLRIAIGRPAL